MMQGTFAVTFVLGKSFSGMVRSPAIKSIFIFACASRGLDARELRVGIGFTTEAK